MKQQRLPAEVTHPWLEPLAVLPVFYKLAGRRVVLAGCNAGAVWKAQLLASCGAQVDVFAPEPSVEMLAAPTDIPAGAITVLQREWSHSDFADAAMAIAASDDEGDCERFVAAARTAGVPVNAIDRPHLCDFQFGAIVNRSPLVVGISTDGAAPVLGQAVRSRIEGLLPRGLARWASAAKAWRTSVKGRLPAWNTRRGFWQRLAERALENPQELPTDDVFEQLVADSPDHTGSVTLVGAGPGDPELLTLKAVRALRTADVILYDDLVATPILSYARREARKLLVGKAGRGPSCRQTDINDLLVDLARRGHRVVRLKGGDPLIFGRAGEEIAACEKAGIPIDIIPGITSAQGAAASIRRSLTHRDSARSIYFVTGHDKAGSIPSDLQWSAMADPATTKAIYMPRGNLDVLLRSAVREGLDPATPALALFNATREDEEILYATAATLAQTLATFSVDGPCLVLLGAALATRPPSRLETDSKPICAPDLVTQAAFLCSL